MKKKVYEQAILSGSYKIPKKCLTTKVIAKLKQELTCIPVVPQQAKQEKKQKINETQFLMYRETDQSIFVPVRYGIDRWGIPKQDIRSIGEPLGDNIVFKKELKLRDHQKKAVQTLTSELQTKGCAGILKMYTGAGKTFTALKQITLLNRRTVFLCHNSAVMQAIHKEINLCLPQHTRVGIIKSPKCEIENKDIILASIQTLTSKIKNGKIQEIQHLLDTIGTVVVDEAHHMGARTFSQVPALFSAKYKFALTATPRRGDKMIHILYWTFGPVVVEILRDLSEYDINVHIITYQNGREKVIGSESKPVFTIMRKLLNEEERRNRFIFKGIWDCIQNEERKQIIVFAHTQKLLGWFAQQLSQVKYNDWGYFTGKQKNKEKDETKQKRVILATWQYAKESVNICGIDTLIFATPSGDIEQAVGRGLRKRDGVLKNVLIIDYVDPFSFFKGMAWKRWKKYRELKYTIKGIPEESHKEKGKNMTSFLKKKSKKRKISESEEEEEEDFCFF